LNPRGEPPPKSPITVIEASVLTDSARRGNEDAELKKRMPVLHAMGRGATFVKKKAGEFLKYTGSKTKKGARKVMNAIGDKLEKKLEKGKAKWRTFKEEWAKDAREGMERGEKERAVRVEARARAREAEEARAREAEEARAREPAVVEEAMEEHHDGWFRRNAGAAAAGLRRLTDWPARLRAERADAAAAREARAPVEDGEPLVADAVESHHTGLRSRARVVAAAAREVRAPVEEDGAAEAVARRAAVGAIDDAAESHHTGLRSRIARFSAERAQRAAEAAAAAARAVAMREAAARRAAAGEVRAPVEDGAAVRRAAVGADASSPKKGFLAGLFGSKRTVKKRSSEAGLLSRSGSSSAPASPVVVASVVGLPAPKSSKAKAPAASSKAKGASASAAGTSAAAAAALAPAPKSPPKSPKAPAAASHVKIPLPSLPGMRGKAAAAAAAAPAPKLSPKPSPKLSPKLSPKPSPKSGAVAVVHPSAARSSSSDSSAQPLKTIKIDIKPVASAAAPASGKGTVAAHRLLPPPPGSGKATALAAAAAPTKSPKAPAAPSAAAAAGTFVLPPSFPGMRANPVSLAPPIKSGTGKAATAAAASQSHIPVVFPPRGSGASFPPSALLDPTLPSFPAHLLAIAGKASAAAAAADRSRIPVFHAPSLKPSPAAAAPAPKLPSKFDDADAAMADALVTPPKVAAARAGWDSPPVFHTPSPSPKASAAAAPKSPKAKGAASPKSPKAKGAAAAAAAAALADALVTPPVAAAARAAREAGWDSPPVFPTPPPKLSPAAYVPPPVWPDGPRFPLRDEVAADKRDHLIPLSPTKPSLKLPSSSPTAKGWDAPLPGWYDPTMGWVGTGVDGYGDWTKAPLVPQPGWNTSSSASASEFPSVELGRPRKRKGKGKSNVIEEQDPLGIVSHKEDPAVILANYHKIAKLDPNGALTYINTHGLLHLVPKDKRPKGKRPKGALNENRDPRAFNPDGSVFVIHDNEFTDEGNEFPPKEPSRGKRAAAAAAEAAANMGYAPSGVVDVTPSPSDAAAANMGYAPSGVVDVTPSPSDAAAAAMGYAPSKVSPHSPERPKRASRTFGQLVDELSGHPPIHSLSKSLPLPASNPLASQTRASAIDALHKSLVRRNTSPTFAPYNSDDGGWA
jgi:hypothetical protein